MNKRFAFFLLLSVAFLDYMGVGLIFPILPSILFDAKASFLPEGATNFTRGLWLGILIALGPLLQLLCSPILGSLSDQRGRKKILLIGLGIGFLSYFFGIWGMRVESLGPLILYRLLFGISTATMTVTQAALVDMSTKETKGRNFAFYSTALGMGFTLGPFLGGILCDSSLVSWFHYSTPFLFGAIATGINLTLLQFFFKETWVVKERKPIEIMKGFRAVKGAFSHPTLRYTFLAFFIFLFGWDYFAEFVSVTLIKIHAFSTAGVGLFHGYMGLCYALSNLVLVSWLTKRYAPTKLLFFSMAVGGFYLLGFHLVPNPKFFWAYTPGIVLVMSLFFPVASTHLSESASDEEQGEILGIYHSIQALSLIISPLFSGSLVGNYPSMPVTLGGLAMIGGGCLFSWNLLRQRKLAQSLDKTR